MLTSNGGSWLTRPLLKHVLFEHAHQIPITMKRGVIKVTIQVATLSVFRIIVHRPFAFSRLYIEEYILSKLVLGETTVYA